MKAFQLTNSEISDLLGQLALLSKAGVPLSDGLYLLAEDETNPKIHPLLTASAKATEEGLGLSAAFAGTDAFPTHVTGLLDVGEQTGRTEETLLALSRYYAEQDRTNKKLRSALTYPIILFFMMMAVIVVLLSKVIPVFEDVYASLGGSLTGIAGGLLVFGNTLNHLLPFLCVLLALLLLAALLFIFMPGLRKRAKARMLQKFGDRGIFRKLNDARFAQALSMAYSSGLPLEECIALAGNLLQDCPDAARRVEDCRTSLNQGQELAQALQASTLMPPASCRMLTLGLRAGTADTTLEEIAQRLSEEAEDTLESKLSMIEPALVIITSLLVGVILISVMLPLMHIMKAIG